MSTFPIHPLSRFESGQTSIKRPREILHFSFDDTHHLQRLSDSSLRYYYPAFIAAPGTSIPRIDLSEGFDSWIRADESVDGHLEGLLQTLQAHEESMMRDGVVEVEDVRVRADVVTWRGMMTKILTAPFDMFSDFEMNATSYQGTIFIEENHAYKLADQREQASRPPARGQPPAELMQYWGYKFESLSTLPSPWSECTREQINSRRAEVVNTNPQYCSIARTSIGSTSLILGGEVDCILGGRPSDPDAPVPWVELKTTAEFSVPVSQVAGKEAVKYERKLLKYWAQSFLLGVPRIVVGFRSAEGFLTRTKELETQKIPGMVTRGEGTWNGNLCINFTAAVLEWVKGIIGEQEGVWRIRRRKGMKVIEIEKVEEEGTGEMLGEAFKRHREGLLAKEIVAGLGRKGVKKEDVSSAG